jgi:hypothetical protein
VVDTVGLIGNIVVALLFVGCAEVISRRPEQRYGGIARSQLVVILRCVAAVAVVTAALIVLGVY